MIEPAIFIARLLQYSGAMVLGGSSLFFLYAAPQVWPRKLLAGAAALLLVTSLLAVALQASLFAGSFTDGFTAEAIGQVVQYLPLGKAALLRAGASLAALTVLILSDRPPSRVAVAALGLITAASLAWLGHAGAGEGWGQIAADTLHTLTAAGWLGALVGLLIVARDSDAARLHVALDRFSALGVPLVAALALSGLVNGWYLVGPDRLASLFTTAYGQLLLAKLAVFGVMLGLAALNRYRLTPALAGGGELSLAPVRRSVAIEAVLGLAVLALVAWFGMLEPPAAL